MQLHSEPFEARRLYLLKVNSGVLATVNGVGDFVSSAMVGVLWTAFGTSVAFGYSAVLFAAGAVLVWQVKASPTP